MDLRIERISDVADPRLARYRELRDRPLAEDSGRFIAESAGVVRLLLASSVEVESLLVTETMLGRLRDVLRAGVPVFVVEDALVRELVGFPFHRGVMAVGVRPATGRLPDGVHRVLVLEDLVDVDNVGAAIRNAAALGVGAVVLSPRCADPYYRKALRTAMGTTFTLPVIRAGWWPAALLDLKARGLTLVGAVVDGEATPVWHLDGRRPMALVFGSEGPGLSPEARAVCDLLATVPMSPNADSLNVATAAAVMLYELGPRAVHAGDASNPGA